MLYLINANIAEHEYMGKTKRIEKNYIVDAQNELEAIQKVEELVKKQDSEYCVTYYVEVNYCHELIT